MTTLKSLLKSEAWSEDEKDGFVTFYWPKLIECVQGLLLEQLEEVEREVEIQAAERYFEDNSSGAKIKRILAHISTLKLEVSQKK